MQFNWNWIEQDPYLHHLNHKTGIRIKAADLPEPLPKSDCKHRKKKTRDVVTPTYIIWKNESPLVVGLQLA